MIEVSIAVAIFVVASVGLGIEYGNMVQLQRINSSNFKATDICRKVSEQVLDLTFGNFTDVFPNPNGNPVPDEMLAAAIAGGPIILLANQQFQVTYTNNFNGNPFLREIVVIMTWRERGDAQQGLVQSRTFRSLQTR